MEKHPSRQQLISAAQTKQQTLHDHLAVCDDCRTLFELYRQFPVTGELSLQDAPSGWIAKAKEIAVSSNPLTKLHGMIARLAFDSWSLPAAVGVRSQTVEQDRRLRFEIGPFLLDIRAERQSSGWDFTAQVTGDQPLGDGVILRVDRQEIKANELGFFQWSSGKPPRHISVNAGDVRLELPEMTWKQKPQS